MIRVARDGFAQRSREIASTRWRLGQLATVTVAGADAFPAVSGAVLADTDACLDTFPAVSFAQMENQYSLPELSPVKVWLVAVWGITTEVTPLPPAR